MTSLIINAATTSRRVPLSLFGIEVCPFAVDAWSRDSVDAQLREGDGQARAAPGAPPCDTQSALAGKDHPDKPISRYRSTVGSRELVSRTPRQKSRQDSEGSGRGKRDGSVSSCKSAVDQQRRTSDVPCLRTGQVGCHRGNLIGVAVAFHG